MTDKANKTLQMMAYGVLSHELMIGRYRPGQALSLRPLALKLGTSPMPVREAVSRLIAERALVLLPNRNVIVPRMTRARFVELSRVRRLLEGEAAELACRQVTPAMRERLVRVNSVMKECLAKGQIRRALAQNLNFHLTLYRAGHSDVLLPLIEMLWRQAGPFVALTPQIPGVKWTARHHDQIIAALKLKDPARVKAAVHDDIDETLQELLRHATFESES